MSTTLLRGEFDSRLLREYFLDDAFDEMFTPDGGIRSHYAALLKVLSDLPREELQRRKQSADVSFLTQGITFTVYGREEGTERIFPYDLLPRLVTGEEWDRIERGLTQRITRSESVSARRLSRRQDSCAGRHSARDRLQLQALPPSDARPAGAAQCLHRGRRHRSAAAEHRRVRRARRQSARAQRRFLHAHQPPRHEAHLSAALSQLRRAPHRALHAGPAEHAALARAGRPA